MNKKVTFLIADVTFIGGIERVNSLLANKFAKDDFEVNIVSLYNTNNVINYTLDAGVNLSFINNKPYSGKPKSLTRFFSHIKSLFRLYRNMLKYKEGVFIINTFPLAFLLYPFAFFRNCVVIEHVHYSYYGKKVQLIRNFIYRKFKKVVCVNKNDVLLFSKYLDNVCFLPNPLSFTAEKCTSLDEKKIIAVGRLEYQKGFDRLIDIFSQANKNVAGWQLHIYGVGNYKNELEDKIQSYGLENVKLMGSVDDLEKIYPDYSIFAFSSRFEGFGMVLTEAMECGLPCISFDCPTGPGEILENGKYGVLIQDNDIKGYQLKLEQLMQSKPLRVEYSSLSKIRSADFNLDPIFDKWKCLVSEANK
ncbi:glycosyltransferase family 4 protein [Pantoea eucrina]|uniref:glycosyltransferase family 4 protein n=1 Tax=Pantoea eucrina TaxID=472693 RepID=UPI0028A0686B|nr:glycosyltransferase family 4 protein [Pantoea eucrina]